MENISNWIHKWAFLNPTKLSMLGENKKYTYFEFSQEIKKMASFLHNQLKVKKGDRIAVLSQNREEYFITYFACAQLGLVVVPLNIRLTAKELVFQIKDSGSKVIFYEREQKKLFEELNQLVLFESAHNFEDDYDSFICNQQYNYSATINENDPYIICYTSGTTGRPKGAVLTQENMLWNALNNKIALDITSSDNCLVLLPLFHIGGIGLFAFPTLLSGGTITVPKRFTPKQTLEIIDEFKISLLMGVPTIFDALRKHQDFNHTELLSLRVLCSGGAPCPKELLSFYHEKGLPLYQGFGMTEASPTIFMLPKEDIKRKVGSIGKPVLFCEIGIVCDDHSPVTIGEIGELIIKGKNVIREYWGLPEQTAQSFHNGWFYTGDLARQDDEGFVYIVGRKKDMIISGGENIYPLEVEQVINELEHVNEVAVVGTFDEKWGEIPIAFVSLNENLIISEIEIQSHCMSNLAKYKIPKKIVFVDEIPKNATGKFDKKQLQSLVNH